MCCRDDIQLLEGPWLEASADKDCFKEFLFEVLAAEYEADGIFASP